MKKNENAILHNFWMDYQFRSREFDLLSLYEFSNKVCKTSTAYYRLLGQHPQY